MEMVSFYILEVLKATIKVLQNTLYFPWWGERPYSTHSYSVVVETFALPAGSQGIHLHFEVWSDNPHNCLFLY